MQIVTTISLEDFTAERDALVLIPAGVKQGPGCKLSIGSYGQLVSKKICTRV